MTLSAHELVDRLQNTSGFKILYTYISMALSKVLMEKLFTYDSLVHAVSGAVGASVAMSVLYPLDTIRSRLQIEEGDVSKSTADMFQQIMDEEGVQGLYRGLTPVLQSLICSNFVYFYSFHGLRAVFNMNNSAGRDLALAAVAGTINVLATTPMWVVNTRMKVNGARHGPRNLRCDYRSIWEGLVDIARNEGLSALWSSTLPSLILVSNPSIQFMVYEALKRRCVYLRIPLSSGTVFTIGAVSKCVATVLTYPIQLAQSKMRYSNDNRTMISVLIYVARNFGVAGLFKGLESKLLQTVSTTALMFMVYEKIAEIVFALLKAEGELQRAKK
ncbi:peroxisomal membrane protein PMP34 [Galendromus occidentalis]|uniref:Peroxisomal membrane protein PMP34 n=1 Tax=Galendromus occidentalis TaxID=34638 RepID=A0AAJ6QNQ8_9ACAR|nr:peroxisomal membrane protein PMP34 [Galendromus occidentalis]